MSDCEPGGNVDVLDLLELVVAVGMHAVGDVAPAHRDMGVKSDRVRPSGARLERDGCAARAAPFRRRLLGALLKGPFLIAASCPPTVLDDLVIEMFSKFLDLLKKI